LIELAEKRPADRAQLGQIKDISRNLQHQDSSAILALIADSSPVAAHEAERVDGLPLTQEQRRVLKRCQHEIEQLAQSTGIASELLARKKQLVQLIHLNPDSVSAGAQIRWPASLEKAWQRPLIQECLTAALNHD
jgi:ribonuclease D